MIFVLLHPAARAIAGASRPLLPYGAPSSNNAPATHGGEQHAPAPHGNEHEHHALTLPGTSQKGLLVGEQEELHLHSGLLDLTNISDNVTVK